jgi:hypothetical protein
MGVELIDSARHPLLFATTQKAKWVGTDDYPTCDEWVDEHEKWLRIAKATGGWDGLLPRLRSFRTERDEAMAEVAAAYFGQEICGYKIAAWEPPGAGNTKGEVLFTLPEGHVFTEVKSPGWEGEAFKQQGAARLKLPKYINGEGGSVDAAAPVRGAVAKAYPKLTDSTPTLLMIVDDRMVALSDSVILVKYALYRPGVEGGTGAQAEDGCFVGQQYERLGGVGILNVDMLASGVRFRFTLLRNPNAVPAVALPPSAFGKWPSFDGLNY